MYISCLEAEQVAYDGARAAYEDVCVAADALKEACDDLPRLPHYLLLRFISSSDRKIYDNLRRTSQAGSIAQEGVADQSPPDPASSEPCHGPTKPSSTGDSGHRSSKGTHESRVQLMIRNALAEEPEEELEANFMKKLSEFSSNPNPLVNRFGLAAHTRARHHLDLRDLMSWRDLQTSKRSMLSALLHLYGEEQQSACSDCQAGLGPFAHCIRFPYQQSQAEARCCTNCLYRWRQIACDLPDMRFGRPILGVDHSIQTITELYEQWYEGRSEVPPLVHLDRQYGHLWEAKKPSGNWRWTFTRERRLLAAIDIVAKERQISLKMLCRELDEVIEPLWGAHPRAERMNHRLLYLTSPGERGLNLRNLYLTIPHDKDSESLSELMQHIRTFHTWKGEMPTTAALLKGKQMVSLPYR